jgi:hypothetical protein
VRRGRRNMGDGENVVVEEVCQYGDDSGIELRARWL